MKRDYSNLKTAEGLRTPEAWGGYLTVPEKVPQPTPSVVNPNFTGSRM